MAKSRELECEFSRSPMSDMERDALLHYPAKPSDYLIKSLRGGVMVFQNILSELWLKGVRLRIVPRGTRLTDLGGCLDLKRFKTEDGKNYYDVKPAGIYRSEDKLIVVKEEYLIDQQSSNQLYRVLIHEFAHAIWYEILWEEDRRYIARLFREERDRCSESSKYRLKNELEFFAEGFLYYVTPPRERGILRAYEEVDEKTGESEHILEEGNPSPHRKTIKKANIRFYKWMEEKFKNLIDPELVMPKIIQEGETLIYDRFAKGAIYEVVHLEYGGFIGSISTLKTRETGKRIVFESVV